MIDHSSVHLPGTPDDLQPNQVLQGANGDGVTTPTLLTDGYRITDGVKPTFVGRIYQLNILAFLSLFKYKRGNPIEFKLATEVKECDKFDDAVFEFFGLTLIQIKYKSCPQRDNEGTEQDTEKSKIGIEKIFKQEQATETGEAEKHMRNSNKKKSDFNLQKYFKSFCALKLELRRNIREVIILTNTTMKTEECGKYFIEKPLKEDHLLYVKDHNVQRYKLNPAEIDFIRKNLLASENCKHFDEFFRKFSFVLNFPNEEQTRNLVAERVGALFKMNSPEIVKSCFFDKIEKWYKDLEPKAINHETIDGFYRQINEGLAVIECIGLHKCNCDNLPKISLASPYNSLDQFINNPNYRTLSISTSSVALTTAKVVRQLQYVFPNQDEFILIVPKHISLISQALESREAYKILVVRCDDFRNFESYLNQFRQVLRDSSRKIIFIIEKHSAPKQLEHRAFGGNSDQHKDIEDNTTFDQLSETSRKVVMEKSIDFQGRSVNVGKVMSATVVNKIFQAKDLHRCFTQLEPFQIRSGWQLPSDSESYYVKRRLGFSESNQNCLEEKHFYALNSCEKIVVVSGDSGLGKTVLFCSIASNMNKNNNLTWAIYLKLDDFAHDELKDYHLSHLKFDNNGRQAAIQFLCKMIVQTEDLSPDQRLTRHLLAVCIDQQIDQNELVPEVVILFDGFDEISPKYRHEVTQFLRHLKDTNIKQIYVSSRNHEIENLLNCFRYENEIQLTEQQLEQTKQLYGDVASLQKPLHFFNNMLIQINTSNQLVTIGVDDSDCVGSKTLDVLQRFDSFRKLKNSITDFPLSQLLKSHTSIRLSIDFLKAKLKIKAEPKYLKHFLLLDLNEAEQVEVFFEHCKANRVDFSKYKQKIFLNEFKNLIRNPLHLTMVAELMVKSQLDFDEKINLYEIYKKLIELKIQIFLKNKQRLSDNANESSKASEERVLKDSQEEAFSCFLLVPCDETNKHTLQKVGLTHNSFKEYLVAIELCETIRKPEIQKLLLVKVLIEDKFRNVRSFLNSHLEEQNDFSKDLRLKVPADPQIQERNGQNSTCIFTPITENNFGILRFLLKTLVSGDFSSHALLNQRLSSFNRQNFIEFLFSKNRLKAIELFSNSSNFNAQTLECVSGFIQEKLCEDVTTVLHYFGSDFTKIDKTIFGTKSILLNIDSHGNTLLHSFGSMELQSIQDLIKSLKNSTMDNLHSLILRKNFNGETILTIIDYTKRSCAPWEGLKDLPQDLLQRLVETTNNEGHTILFDQNSKRLCPIALRFVCSLPKLSVDFLILTIFDNLFRQSLSLKKLYVEVKNALANNGAGFHTQKLKASIETILHRSKKSFGANLKRLNEAFTTDSSAIDDILEDSKPFIREIILACDYNQQTVLMNSKIVLQLLKHLQQHSVVYQHWILKICNQIIKFNCEDTFQLIFEDVWNILLSLETSAFYAYLLKYIRTIIEYNCFSMLQIVLDFCDNCQKYSKEDLILYGNSIILKQISETSCVELRRNFKNESKDRLLNWLLQNIDQLKVDTFIQVLSLRAKFRVEMSVTEKVCWEKLNKWFGEISEISSEKMRNIFFGVASFGFSASIKELIHKIEDKRFEFVLPFQMIDIIQHKYADGQNALHLAARNGFLQNVIQSFQDSKFNSILLQLLHQQDCSSETVLHCAAFYERNFIESCKFIFKIYPDEIESFLKARKRTGYTLLNCIVEYQPKFIEILFYLTTQCGKTCKTLVFDFVKESLSNGWLLTDRPKVAKIIKFLIKVFRETDMEVLLSTRKHDFPGLMSYFWEDEILFLRVLNIISKKFSYDDWKNIFLFGKLQYNEDLLQMAWSNQGFLDILTMATKNLNIPDLYCFLGKTNDEDENILHISFRRGIALKVISIIPCKYLKMLLCKRNRASQTPFSYFQSEENVQTLSTFLVTNLYECEIIEILQELGITVSAAIDNQLRLAIEKEICICNNIPNHATDLSLIFKPYYM